ncbi:hypothetical protein K503DRAFT_807209 [Rhizopogon vinicolor AM-OR11-026]|uniref:Uncharacterized protein n=1 Tax=Rhizopogon vinicolor AM-OR11-026 TaxID=1314800 RepID=A0A1B7MD12_9AGAM|nr:hypothetical protein K503DRAFT_807209 [Rhizopogon vinicolor AM-OR11-026]
MIFLPLNVIFLAIVVVILNHDAPRASARPVTEVLSNTTQARRYSEYVPPMGSDTLNPGTLYHPATIAVHPLEEMMDTLWLGAFDGHDEGSGVIDKGEGPLDELAQLQ